MKLKQMLLLIFILILVTLRCDTTEPPIKASLSLTLEDVSCTEVWLTLKASDIPLPTYVVLKQNDQTRATINLTKADTLLYIDSLLPKQAYTFQIASIQYPEATKRTQIRSTPQATTLRGKLKPLVITEAML